MATYYEETAIVTGNTALPVMRPTDADYGLMAYFPQAWDAGKRGMWLRAGSYGVGLGAADDGSATKLYEIAHNREFVPASGSDHPVLVTLASGKPALRFAPQGSVNANGDMTSSSIMAGASETNRLPLMTPGGYTWGFEGVIPLPNSMLEGVTWSASTGGFVLGSMEDDSTNKAFEIYFDANGKLTVRNQSGTGTIAPASGDGQTDLRTGTRFNLIAAYNPAGGIATMWVNGAQVYTTTGKTTDIDATVAASALPRIAALGASTGDVGAHFEGLLCHMIWLPTLDGFNADFRAAALAAMAQ